MAPVGQRNPPLFLGLVRAPVDEVMQVLCEAAGDIDFACQRAPERLLVLASLGSLVGAGAWWGGVRRAGAEVRTPAPVGRCARPGAACATTNSY